MDSVRYSLMLLQEHMLFIDYYIPLGKYQRWHDIPSLATAPILKHIDQYRRSPEMQSSTKEAIDQAVLTLLRYKGVLPTPTVPFLELIHIFTNHMNIVSLGNQVSGRYVLQALCFFYRCDKIEAFIRYVAPLIQHKVLRNASTSRPALRNNLRISVSELIRIFEESTYSANPPTSLPLRLPMSDVLPRITAVYSYLSQVEGVPEFMFASHNFMTFAKNDEEIQFKSISQGPVLLKRCWLGSSWFLGQKSLSPQSEIPNSTDHCAIISGDDYQLAVFCLTSTNNPGTNKADRREWAPVFAAVGFPSHIHPSAIQSGIKQIIDALEVRYGPREQLPYQASDCDPTVFRELCYTIGRTIYDLTNAIFYQPGNLQGEIVPRQMLSAVHSPLSPLQASHISIPLTSGYSRKVTGLPHLMTDFTGFLAPPFSSQSMSAKTLAATSRIMLLASSFSQSASGFNNIMGINGSSGAFTEGTVSSNGFINIPSPSAAPSLAVASSAADNVSTPLLTRLACCIFYHGNLIVSDTHPYIARLLWLATFSWHSTNAKRAAEAQQAGSAGGASSATRRPPNPASSSKNAPAALPINYLFPRGPFADYSLKPKQPVLAADGLSFSRPSRSNNTHTGPSGSDRSSQQPPDGSSGGGMGPPPSNSIRNCVILDSYLTTQDCALLWFANRQGPRPMEGWHPTVHLTHSGIDLIMLFHADITPTTVPPSQPQHGSPLSLFSPSPVQAPVSPNAASPLGSPHNTVRNRLYTTLPQHVGSLLEEMQILRHSIAKHDVIRKPRSIMNATNTKQRRLPETCGFVHNKATASTTFVEGAGSGDSSGLTVLGEAADGITPANLQRSCQLVAEASSVARLLGAKMHASPNTYFSQSLASKPITRVILGRSSFGDYGDKPGAFNLLYGKETAGQQCVVGTSSLSVTVRNSEDQFLLFAGACAKNNIAVV